MGDLSFDLGSAVPYAVEKVLSIFGADSISVSAKAQLEERAKLGSREASTVQCVGMSRPVPIDEIYQPTRLRDRENRGGNVWKLGNFTNAARSAVVWGSPGAGKSVFLKRCYLELLRQPASIPLLFLLRQSGTIDELETLVSNLREKKTRPKEKQIVLLVDGYDEVTLEERRRVSVILATFETIGAGWFVLTCRKHYEIVDLPAPYYWVEPFERHDAVEYLRALTRFYPCSAKPEEVVAELVSNGFEDFMASPLMLTLVCVLKSGPLRGIPRSSIGLIRRAIDTLTFRWDESKGISREDAHSIDGEERVRCLMRIAFSFSSPDGSESQALEIARMHLGLNQRRDIKPQKFLEETAQWYGLFVPASEARWTFTHRSIHDFLAARHWVESGEYARALTNLDTVDMTTRLAYAACMSLDATVVMCGALRLARDYQVFNECLSNGVPFDVAKVAEALADRFKTPWVAGEITYSGSSLGVELRVTRSPLRLASDDTLLNFFEASVVAPVGKGMDILYCLSAYELQVRNVPLRTKVPDARSKLIIVIVEGNIAPYHLSDRVPVE